MRLEIESIDIKDIQTGPKTSAKDGVLCINTKELEELILKDNRIESVDINLVRPGDRVRIVNLMDEVQPRCKIDRFEADFPGFVGRLQTAGSGRTRSLCGVAVLVSNPCTKRIYLPFLDMSGLGAEMGLYGKTKNISIAPHISEGTEERDFEDAAKIAGFKTAVFLAAAAKGHTVAETEVYELDMANTKRSKDLPRVAYYFQAYTPQHDHHGTSDACFYGTEVSHFMPTIIHPNEVLDGGVVGDHVIRSTYSTQNHGVIKELYRRHGRELIFAGVVFGVASTDPVTRKRKSLMAANLIKNVLGADGAVLTKIHGGMPHVDLALVGEECEKLGVRTAIFVEPLVSSGTLAEALLFNNESLNLVITMGATLERIQLPLGADRILGGTAETNLSCPDPIEQHAGDAVVNTEELSFAGIHDHLGGARIIVTEY